jgi:hypothetical protein
MNGWPALMTGPRGRKGVQLRTLRNFGEPGLAGPLLWLNQ